MAIDIDKQRIEKAVDGKLNEIADFLFTTSQDNIVEMDAIDEGMLLNSGYVHRNWLEKEIGYSAPYATFVEYGTDPHFPNVEALKGWARRKLGLTEKEANRAAWAIAKKIAKEGTDPKPFMRDAIAATKAKYRGEIFGA